MGAIGGMLGLNGGINGTGISGPQAAPITGGTDLNQINQAYAGNQGALQSQQGLLTALQGQGGIGNQSQVYNQLQGVVNGTGPNPAQAQLAQATGANTANQAALMASQRGVGANPGMIARQAAQQGAANQQNAAGQAATLQANQSLNALGQAGNIAGNQVANQIGATGANTQAQQSEQGILQGALNNTNQANVAMQGNINTSNAGLAGNSMSAQQGLVGGILGAGGKAMAGGAEGGFAGYGYADGGTAAGPQSFLGKYAAGMGDSFSGLGGAAGSGGAALNKGMASFGSGLAHQLTPTPVTNVPLSQVQNMDGSAVAAAPPPAQAPVANAQGGNVGPKLKSGGGVPGQAKVTGNSYANDNVKALLSPGEGVIDRETMHAPGQIGDAARFVMAYVNRKKGAK